MLFTQGLPSLNSIKKKLSEPELGVIQIIVGKLFNELSSYNPHSEIDSYWQLQRMTMKFNCNTKKTHEERQSLHVPAMIYSIYFR